MDTEPDIEFEEPGLRERIRNRIVVIGIGLRIARRTSRVIMPAMYEGIRTELATMGNGPDKLVGGIIRGCVLSARDPNLSRLTRRALLVTALGLWAKHNMGPCYFAGVDRAELGDAIPHMQREVDASLYGQELHAYVQGGELFV